MELCLKENTGGLVKIQDMRELQLDGFQWYCDHCDNLLYEKFFTLRDIVKDLPIVFLDFSIFVSCLGGLGPRPSRQSEKINVCLKNS